MSRPGKTALIAGLVLMALAATLLSQFQRWQKLGRPGVKVVAQDMRSDAGDVIGTNTVDLPAQVLDWQSQAMPVSTQVLAWLPKDTVYGQRVYHAPDGFGVQMNVVLMGSDRTSIHKPEYCLPSQGVRIDSRETRTVPIRGPQPYFLPVTVFTLTRATERDGVKSVERALYVFWFVADNQITADHNERMRWMARDLLTRLTLQRWAYVSCVVGCAPGQEEAAFARLSQFLADAVPKFQLAVGPPAQVAQRQP